MKLLFSYDIDKDIENYIASRKSINNKKPTKMANLFIEKYGEDFSTENLKEFISSYLREQKIDMEVEINKLTADWSKIENVFTQRAERIFDTIPTKEINVYLTTDNRSTYNVKQNYFFVSMQSNNRMHIIMHELFHFYTWYLFYDKLIRQGVSPEKYNDIKESLTEILNLEFADLLQGKFDEGYPQHKKLRETVKDQWLKSKDIQLVVSELINL